MNTKPVIFTIDDDPQVLSAVERDLLHKYQKDYRVVKTNSAQTALDLVKQLKRKNIPIAVFLVDQRMPGKTGTEFLEEAKLLFPGAKKVLLTAYADTEAAIVSINKIGLDYYLLKPWDPPEEKLYPILDELLEVWAISARIPFKGISVVGTLWSPKSHDIKDFLSRHQIPYKWLDVESSDEAKQLAASVPTKTHYPLVFFPDGSYFVEPSVKDVAVKIGLQTKAQKPFYDLVIIGGGPAGLASAVYASSEGLNVIMIEKAATGGQAGESSRIDNYLGFPQGVSGADLARRAVTQAKRFGTEIITAQEVVKLRVEDPYRYVILEDETEISTHAILISTGVSVRILNIPGADRLTGAGVYYGAAYTEAAHYKGKNVFVVGAGNSAGQGALFLSRYARQVTMLVRGETLETSMSKYLIDQIEQTKKIKTLFNIQVTEVNGKDKLDSIIVINTSAEKTKALKTPALFIFIGALPHTDFAGELIVRNEKGYILTGPDMVKNGKPTKGWRLSRDPFTLETNVAGIFAAGDVRLGATNRVASAVGEGAVAVHQIHQYLKTV